MTSISLPILKQSSQSSPAFKDSFEWTFADQGEGVFYLFEDEDSSHLYIADGSRIYVIPTDAAEQLKRLELISAEQAVSVLHAFGIPILDRIGEESPESINVRSFSLAVAQKCNLGCTYCYAQEGDFGGKSKNMHLETALLAVERLFDGIIPEKESVKLSFLGGEPLINREVIRAAALYAVKLGKEQNVSVGFSITSNGTLLTAEDADFFEEHGFSVTISLDGDRETHDSLRSYKSGRGSYDRIIQNIKPLLERQQNMQVSARVTVTPRNLSLVETLRELVSLGFYSVGFSPMLSSPTGRDQMNLQDLSIMLGQMIECGQEFERHFIANEHFPFSNMSNSLNEIHRGTHRPYPCGAGGGYMGVSAEGELFACHRFVDDSKGRMGDLIRGVEPARQKRWLKERHVHKQEPCRTCWARYLCGGGCHHEVINRGRLVCEYVRGWLDYCLKAYVRLSRQRPDFFN